MTTGPAAQDVGELAVPAAVSLGEVGSNAHSGVALRLLELIPKTSATTQKTATPRSAHPIGRRSRTYGGVMSVLRHADH